MKTKYNKPLPTVEEAGVIAVTISDIITNPPLSAHEQAFFVAGFQECIKYLMLDKKQKKQYASKK